MPPTILRVRFSPCQSPHDSLQGSLQAPKMMLKLLNVDHKALHGRQLDPAPTGLCDAVLYLLQAAPLPRALPLPT